MRTKVMFDSSCVYAVVSPSLEENLASQLPIPSNDCKYYTGPYLRMEFLRVWVITGIKIYFRARRTQDLPGTFHYFSNAFGREPKIALHWAARYMKSVQNEDVAEPIERFGYEVVDLALTYDIIFSTSVQHKTGCTRGTVELDFGEESMKDILCKFYARFTAEHTCKLDSVMNLQGGCPKLHRVIHAESDTLPSAQKRAFGPLQVRLRELIANPKSLTCKSCQKFGDLIVALEQPPKTVLYHTDHSFSVICPLLNHTHRQVSSALLLEPKIEIEMAS